MNFIIANFSYWQTELKFNLLVLLITGVITRALVNWKLRESSKLGNSWSRTSRKTVFYFNLSIFVFFLVCFDFGGEVLW